MITMHHPSWITTLVISFSILFVIFYWFCVLPLKQAKNASLLSALSGSICMTLVVYNVVDRLAPFGGVLIVVNWIVPSLCVWHYREHFCGLDQRKLVFLQVFRLIGGLFILEMYRGHIPASFALPAGSGDIAVGLMAVGLLTCYKTIPRGGAIALITMGVIDFISALFFGVTSLPGRLQLFAQGFNNQVNLFPTGMIPLFLVPIALVFHTLSLIELINQKN